MRSHRVPKYVDRLKVCSMTKVDGGLRFGLLFVSSMMLSVGHLFGQAPSATPAPIRLLEGHTKPIYAVAYSPDGKFIYTASFDHTVKIWNRETGQVLRTFTDHKNGVLALAVAKN